MTNSAKLGLLVIVHVSVNMTGCFVYQQRDRALIEGIDIDETLKVAEVEIKENRVSTVLTVWAMRDQELTGAQAEKVAELYSAHIERIDSEEQKARGFSVWHLTWAISSMYRLGDDPVKHALKEVYDDASIRVDELDSRVAQLKEDFADRRPKLQATLGVGQYRGGNWQAAVDTIRASMRARMALARRSGIWPGRSGTPRSRMKSSVMCSTVCSGDTRGRGSDRVRLVPIGATLSQIPGWIPVKEANF